MQKRVSLFKKKYRLRQYMSTWVQLTYKNANKSLVHVVPQAFPPMGAQLSLKVALPLVERLATTPDSCNDTGSSTQSYVIMTIIIAGLSCTLWCSYITNHELTIADSDIVIRANRVYLQVKTTKWQQNVIFAAKAWCRNDPALAFGAEKITP